MTNDRTRELLDAVHSGAVAGVREGCLLIENSAKQLSPVKTGNNRRSIHTEVVESANRISGKVGPSTDYGIHLEFGTKRMAARPFMRPAVESNKDEVVSIIIQRAREAVRAALGGR